MLLKGTALVTGAGSGIGRAVALACAASGCRAITIADKNFEDVKQTECLVKEINSHLKVLTVDVDVSESTPAENLVLSTLDAFGRLDYAFNVAGISCKARVATATYPMQEYDNIQAINARGLALCTQFEIRAMLEQDPRVTIDSHSPLRAQRGSIVNIASTCATNVIPDLFPYVASKHTVMGITKAAGIDHAKDLVRVNAVCPGLVETPMIAARRAQLQHREQETPPSIHSEAWAPANMYNTPLGRLALADEVADTCIFLASSMASHITASSITVDGGRTTAY